MFAENPEVRAELLAIARQATSDPQLHEDFCQEALLNLIRKETLEPGQTVSWYLQNCDFHVMDYLGQGRSIDAFKRHSYREIESSFEGNDGGTQYVAPGADVVSTVSAKDILDLLLARLKPLDQQVLLLLDDGYSRRQIALKIGISQSKAVRACKRIVALATHFRISPKLNF